MPRPLVSRPSGGEPGEVLAPTSLPAVTLAQLVAVPIWVGVVRLAVVPSPSWPFAL